MSVSNRPAKTRKAMYYAQDSLDLSKSSAGNKPDPQPAPKMCAPGSGLHQSANSFSVHPGLGLDVEKIEEFAQRNKYATIHLVVSTNASVWVRS